MKSLSRLPKARTASSYIRCMSNVSIDVPYDHPQLEKRAMEIYAEHGAVVVRGLNREYVQVSIIIMDAV